MSDSISRQAAIDALCKRCDLVHDVPCTEECNDIKILRKLPSTDRPSSRLTNIYIRDKESGCVRRVGDNQHDMLTITEDGELAYLNLQNGDGCRTGGGSGGYEFVPNEDDYGYNIDPRKYAKMKAEENGL